MAQGRMAAEAFAGCAKNWRRWAIQFASNALLAALFAAWLLIPVESTAQLALNLVAAVLLAAATGVLHGGTLNSFHSEARREERPLRREFALALENLFAILLCAGAVYLLWTAAGKAAEYREILPAYVRSGLPVSLRRIVSLALIEKTFDVLLFVLRWVAVPGLVLPFLASASRLGVKGFARGAAQGKKAFLSVSYWAVLAVAALVGVFATGKIMRWTPDFRTSTLGEETASVVLRSLAAYLLSLFSWLLACSVAGRLAGEAGDAANDAGGDPAA
jgi:hypothetical protein